MRIYDVNKYRLETVIELPIENRGDPISTLFIEKSYLSDDASRVIYSLGQSFFYECELPQKNNLGVKLISYPRYLIVVFQISNLCYDQLAR